MKHVYNITVLVLLQFVDFYTHMHTHTNKVTTGVKIVYNYTSDVKF